MTDAADDVAAVVVNHNAGGLLTDCVRSLRGEGIETIVVVDNGSTDGSLTTLTAADPAARVVRMPRNVGYGTAANRGVATTATPYVLVLNPDTVVEPGLVKGLVAALERDPQLGLVAPRLDNPDGTLYPSVRHFPNLADALGHAFLVDLVPNNRFTRRYRMLDWDHREARRVDWVSGACFLARRPAFDAVGGFDEAYFMYMEDVDLCWRLGRAGWFAGYEPSVGIMHVQGVSTARAPYRMVVAHHRSMLRFWWRSTTPSHRLLAPVVALGVGVRAAAEVARRAIEARRVR
ncbi:MAG TPA: glycosyltransferase family 2 protein [Acidimicrobiales bacterium]|nr:glycosyltransferase family 2 protein [Acidimicrobiales bacterium]